MSNIVGAQNIQDASLNPATFTLGTAGTTATSAAVDLGSESIKPGNFELELAIPALTTTMNTGTNTSGVTYIIESSTTSTFVAIDQTLASYNSAGSTTTALAAKSLRTRVPSNCARYIRGKVLPGTTGGDMSTLVGTLTLRF